MISSFNERRRAQLQAEETITGMPMPVAGPPKFKLCLSAILQRGGGWTRSAIDEFLGEPDELLPNPKYPTGASMKLYYIDRIDAVERTPEFQALTSPQERRAKSISYRWHAKLVAERAEASSRRSVDRSKQRREELLTEVAAMTFLVPILSSEELRQQVVDANPYHRHHRDAETVSDRECAYYLRIAAGYITAIDRVQGKPGAQEARDLIGRLVSDAIAKAYPHLAPSLAEFA